jgi:hypothetical protein
MKQYSVTLVQSLIYYKFGTPLATISFVNEAEKPFVKTLFYESNSTIEILAENAKIGSAVTVKVTPNV